MCARIPAPNWLYDDTNGTNDGGNCSNNESKLKLEDKQVSYVNRRDQSISSSCSSSSSAPKNVPSHLWEKFQKLEKRTEEVTKRSTEKRIKHLQNEIINKVHEEITDPEDLDILRAHDVKFGPPNVKCDKRKKKKRPLSNISDTKDVSTEDEAEFSEINKYMGVNDHLKGVDHGRYAPKTELEERIGEAVARGDLDKAEMLSDHLSSREFGKRVCEAIDARAYTVQKKEESESAKAKRKKKLAWGFIHKERWETKGNM